MIAAAFSDHVSVTAALQPGSSIVLRRDTADDGNATSQSAARELCHDVLAVDRWTVWFGTPVQSFDEALKCYDPRNTGSCMRQVQTVLEHHIPEGGSILEHVVKNFNSIVQLKTIEVHGGVCEVPSELILPFVRLRILNPHHRSSPRDRHARQQEALRRAEEERQRVLMARGIPPQQFEGDL